MTITLSTLSASLQSLPLLLGGFAAPGVTDLQHQDRFPRPVSDYPAVPLAGGIVARLDLPEAAGSPCTIRVPTPDARPDTELEELALALALVPNSVRSDSYQLVEHRADGTYVPVEPGPERTYTGVVSGVEGSRVAASLLAEGLFAAVFLPDGSRLWVEPLSEHVPSADRGLHVVYWSEDTFCEGQCGTTDEHRVGPRQEQSVLGSCAGGVCVAELAVDADFEYFTDHGSSSLTVQDDIAAIVNVVNHQYQTQVDITHVLTTVIVRTLEPDPYATTDPQALLVTFQNLWNTVHAAVVRDTAHLFTGKNVDGGVIGIAYLGAVCDTSFGYGLSQSDFTGSYACKTDLTAHEIGHNWNAGHCGCPSTTMNPFITCANTFIGGGSSTVAQVDAYRDGAGCLTNGGVPPANDTCSTATPITGSTSITSDNAGANSDGATTCGFPGGGGKDLYWVITPTVSGTVTVDTCGSSINTVLSVHSACPARPVNEIACNDDHACACPGATDSCVSFGAAAGATYWIRVAGYDGAAGAFNLNVNMPGFTPICPGDGSVASCPCGNDGSAGRGCENSILTGGALLGATGDPELTFDTLVMTSSGERPTSLTIFLQGTTSIAPVGFGDGLRCAGGTLKRLYTKNASGGVATAPAGADPSVSARSAALGDPIASGTERYYLAYYRDPDPVFCPDPPGSTFNSSSGLRVRWD